ncbi:helix-turn-helix domain-containing protein [Runella slithyformis]|uniref:Transcriptional regulator, AraC family n=1 Tax=Runella slithyformis (strain ATCC 29530 / DSM 19594 / LMG 11500 / NCIMB 11436 / LSU 4) TaxID=761193 RepID=A0A7U4E977_RUNSL|nr:helix-turn-helix domain-containing protein [Runella slithyformis]AEI52209.1 transcriptional regulator, AraC family [Runella slithyformis DSM 19594]
MKKNIPTIDPQLFVKDYFDHSLMEEDGFNISNITPKEQNCFFYISPIEAGTKYINFPVESIKTTYYEVIFVTNGYYVVTDNLNELTQTEGQIRFVSPGKISSIQKLSNDIEGYYCLFDQAFIDTYSGVANLLNSFTFFDLDALPVISLSDQQAQFFALVFKKMNFDFVENYKITKPIICQYLVAIFKESSLYYEKISLENKKLTSADRIGQGFIRLVNKHYLSKRTLAEYATLLNITTKHLTKSVKQATGETPMDFIYKMLILEAKVLLKETALTVAEIAYQLSFDDAAHFGRFFKQHTGNTPVEFRNKT